MAEARCQTGAQLYYVNIMISDGNSNCMLYHHKSRQSHRVVKVEAKKLATKPGLT